MQLFIATFDSPLYPEDNCILGAFSTEEKAEAAIQASIELDKHSHPNFSARYQQHRSNYDIVEAELDERII